MPVSKSQAVAAGQRHTVFHHGHCEVGRPPQRWRSNGRCKTWLSRPTEFRLPIKHGLHRFGYLTHNNCGEFHHEDDCAAWQETARTESLKYLVKGEDSPQA